MLISGSWREVTRPIQEFVDRARVEAAENAWLRRRPRRSVRHPVRVLEGSFLLRLEIGVRGARRAHRRRATTKKPPLVPCG